MADNLNVAEIYKTIQGESSRSGLPCVIVRLAGCNLNCTFCDTPYARTGGTPASVEQIVADVLVLRVPLVEVTGGEPLLQEGTRELLEALLSSGLEVLLETNGSLPIDAVPSDVVKIYDIKCPGSGESHQNRWENLPLLGDRDEVKFVVSDRSDYEWAKETIERHALDRFTVLLSPADGRLGAAEVSSWILEDSLRARVNLQLHKIIWPKGEPRTGKEG